MSKADIQKCRQAVIEAESRAHEAKNALSDAMRAEVQAHGHLLSGDEVKKLQKDLSNHFAERNRLIRGEHWMQHATLLDGELEPLENKRIKHQLALGNFDFYGWECPKSPVDICVHIRHEEGCVFCHEPRERK